MLTKLGFTGTQRGMSNAQREKLEAWLQARSFSEAHHGDCIGADAEFHALVMYIPTCIIIHPPRNAAKRANCCGNLVLPAKEYIARNHDIVDACDVLIATPAEMEEILRSGTWATIRYAKRIGKPIIIFYSDGSVAKC